jgi:protein-arginine kinase activator protein McsA
MQRSRTKPCYLCQKSAPVLYRIQRDESGEWIFVCADCWQQVSQDNPHYVYGGTWKAEKKR